MYSICFHRSIIASARTMWRVSHGASWALMDVRASWEVLVGLKFWVPLLRILQYLSSGVGVHTLFSFACLTCVSGSDYCSRRDGNLNGFGSLFAGAALIDTDAQRLWSHVLIVCPRVYFGDVVSGVLNLMTVAKEVCATQASGALIVWATTSYLLSSIAIRCDHRGSWSYADSGDIDVGWVKFHFRGMRYFRVYKGSLGMSTCRISSNCVEKLLHEPVFIRNRLV